ncbi:MAG TPA: glutathione S-transferase family protein [Rhizomicrobium sp.]|nr:glutathione S-transferase family protein [Rhizomicrobium sp.]
MITLYHAPRSRSSRFIFLLEELGAPYEIHKVSIRRGDGSGAADPANPHPHGKVPAIRDGETLVFESAAVALYLTDKFPANRIGPLPGDSRRGAYLTWLAYYAGEMEPAWVSKFMKVIPPRGTAGWVAPEEIMPFVNATLEKGPYLLGEEFSAADILVGTTFKLFMGSPMLEKTPLLEAYVQRVTDRPAYARAAARDNG